MFEDKHFKKIPHKNNQVGRILKHFSGWLSKQVIPSEMLPKYCTVSYSVIYTCKKVEMTERIWDLGPSWEENPGGMQSICFIPLSIL